MFGRAMKCDICNTVEIVDMTDETASDVGAFPGWLRVASNEAHMYNWNRNQKPQSSMVEVIDACSISCVRSFLLKITDNINKIEDATNAAEAYVE